MRVKKRKGEREALKEKSRSLFQMLVGVAWLENELGILVLSLKRGGEMRKKKKIVKKSRDVVVG